MVYKNFLKLFFDFPNWSVELNQSLNCDPLQSSSNFQNHINDLPNEILANIFQRLDFGEKIKFRHVCSHWKQIGNQNFEQLKTFDFFTKSFKVIPFFYMPLLSTQHIQKSSLKSFLTAVGKSLRHFSYQQCANFDTIWKVLTDHCTNLTSIKVTLAVDKLGLSDLSLFLQSHGQQLVTFYFLIWPEKDFAKGIELALKYLNPNKLKHLALTFKEEHELRKVCDQFPLLIKLWVGVDRNDGRYFDFNGNFSPTHSLQRLQKFQFRSIVYNHFSMIKMKDVNWLLSLSSHQNHLLSLKFPHCKWPRNELKTLGQFVFLNKLSVGKMPIEVFSVIGQNLVNLQKFSFFVKAAQLALCLQPLHKLKRLSFLVINLYWAKKGKRGNTKVNLSNLSAFDNVKSLTLIDFFEHRYIYGRAFIKQFRTVHILSKMSISHLFPMLENLTTFIDIESEFIYSLMKNYPKKMKKLRKVNLLCVKISDQKYFDWLKSIFDKQNIQLVINKLGNRDKNLRDTYGFFNQYMY